MLDTRDASIRWAEQRLALMLPHESPSELAGRAEVLVAIAEQYRAPMEALIEWIDAKAPGKEWSAVEWRRFCEWSRARALPKPPDRETGDGLC